MTRIKLDRSAHRIGYRVSKVYMYGSIDEMNLGMPTEEDVIHLLEHGYKIEIVMISRNVIEE